MWTKPRKAHYIYKKLIDINRDIDITSSTALGEGTYGKVVSGIKKATGKTPEIRVAIKYLKADKVQTGEDQQKFTSEIGCQDSLQHPAILPLIGYSIPYRGSGAFTVITPFMANKSLHDVLDLIDKGQKPADWTSTKAAICVVGIAFGMAYCHQTDVIHRDLKTENILLDDDFHPQICDFGLSKIFEEGTQNAINMTRSIGTPLCMAPELVDDESPNYSGKVDVFAYAIILYEIITCAKPYADKKNFNTFNLLKYVSEGNRQSLDPKRFTKFFMDMIGACWAHSPNNRPSFKEICQNLIKDENKSVFMEQFNGLFDDDVDENELDDYIAIVKEGINLD